MVHVAVHRGNAVLVLGTFASKDCLVYEDSGTYYVMLLLYYMYYIFCTFSVNIIVIFIFIIILTIKLICTSSKTRQSSLAKVPRTETVLPRCCTATVRC